MASTSDTMGAVTPTPEWEVQLPEPVGYESPVMEMIYHASDNPADKSLPVFSLAQVLEMLRNAGVALPLKEQE